MNEQQNLYALMEVATEQQQAVNTALAALNQQHTTLKNTTGALQAIINEQLIVATEKAAGKGATAAVKTALADITEQATDAEQKLKGAVAWFGWRWGLLATGIGFGVVLAMVLCTWTLLWWQRSQLDDIKAEKAQLNEDIATAQQTLDMLNSKTGGVRYVDATNGRFLLINKGYEVKECNNKTPCIKLK